MCLKRTYKLTNWRGFRQALDWLRADLRGLELRNLDKLPTWQEDKHIFMVILMHISKHGIKHNFRVKTAFSLSISTLYLDHIYAYKKKLVYYQRSLSWFVKYHLCLFSSLFVWIEEGNLFKISPPFILCASTASFDHLKHTDANQ